MVFSVAVLMERKLLERRDFSGDLEAPADPDSSRDDLATGEDSSREVVARIMSSSGAALVARKALVLGGCRPSTTRGRGTQAAKPKP